MAMEEEVWKDITLSALPETNSSDQPFPPTILQDFLPIPLLSNPTSSPSSSSSTIHDISLSHHPQHPSLSSFSLNSDPPDFGFHFLETRALVNSKPPQQKRDSTSNSSVQLIKKRATKKSVESPEKRFLRLMKNRDSADRARARKEAYTKELEIKLANLKKENALLHKQYISADQ
ncbi:bZIP transcription factor 27 isoform X2 [Cannabis sativa]|uniref:bZIP transcription factor 27 isoform X2 n=1 Tax=Cannabis sativa TaxID=3483 RepID=UPI0011DFA31D|nr:bZIP transcription factor 27 isoform X2 [Cannabis sativa]